MTLNFALNNDVNRFRNIVERRLGLYFDDGKRDFLADLLRTRLEKNGESGANYLQRLENGAPPAEWGALGQLLTVPETYFFRHFDQLRAFAEVALSDRMQAQAAGKRLAILSLGCATGEEAYSLAVMVRETMMDVSWSVSILAVDISPAAIEKAVAARYSAWALRETPADMRQKWFRQHGHDYVLDQAIRKAVRFEQRNLAEDDPNFWRSEMYDVIFCRNMMMYFSPERARALVARISRVLIPGGYLFLGHAETLRGLSQDFHLCHTHETFYYQRRTRDEARPSEVVLTPGTTGLPPPLAAILDEDNTWVDAIQRSSERIQELAEQPVISAGYGTTEKLRWDLSNAFELLKQERFVEALNVVRVLPVEAGSDADALLLKAVLCAHSGQLAEAEQVCRQLLDVDELNAGAQYVLALCCEGTGDNRAAVDHDQMAVYLDPGFAMPRLHLGLLARRAGDREFAQRELGQALTLLQLEDASRLLLFGGGFGREALLALCRAELIACGGKL